MIRDFNVDWLRKRIYIPVQTFSSVTKTGTTGTQNYGSGGLEMVNIATLGIAGLKYTANTNTALHYTMVPYDLDINKQIDFRVHWTSDNASDANQWKVLYNAQNAPVNSDLATTASNPGATNAGLLTAAATALNTVIPTSTSSATTGTVQITDYGTINKSTLLTRTYAWTLTVGTTGTFPTGPLYLLGLEIRYTMRKTVGQRRNILGGRRLAEPLGVQWTSSRQEGL